MRKAHVAVIGAGVGGLAAAMDMAQAGLAVTVFERAATPGGKLREIAIDTARMDAGPSVFTMREVFDDLFAAGGEHFDSHVTLTPAAVLARHAWDTRGHLDLYAQVEQSTQAIREFAGGAEARGFEAFTAHARAVFRTLEHSFIRASRPSPIDLVRRVRWRGLPGLWGIQPFRTLWRAVERYFKDPRLRQLFGRYATYCGSSPFSSPATLMLVAHVEQAGVWYVEGGMYRLADQLAAAAARRGASFRYRTEVSRVRLHRGRVCAVELQDGEQVPVDAIVCNADVNALADGCFGAETSRSAAATPRHRRSLSALTWNSLARTSGFPLAHHTVFFSADYRREFDDIFERRRLPSEPSIYMCAQDRCDAQPPRDDLRGGPERLFCLVNAPAIGDTHGFNQAEIDRCEAQVFQRLAGLGLKVQASKRPTATTPTDFNRMFPATGGALYGPASHGWRASFRRSGSRSRIRGLYLAGGSVHPGPGVPMAATSGRLAAACVIKDCASTRR